MDQYVPRTDPDAVLRDHHQTVADQGCHADLMHGLHLLDASLRIVRIRLHQDGGGALFIRLGVLHALQAGVMLHEAGGEDAGGDRHGADAQEGDDHPHDPP